MSESPIPAFTRAPRPAVLAYDRRTGCLRVDLSQFVEFSVEMDLQLEDLEDQFALRLAPDAPINPAPQ